MNLAPVLLSARRHFARLALLATALPVLAQPLAVQHTLVYGPYKHLNTGVDSARPVATTQVTGTVHEMAPARGALLPKVQAVSLAFASGECGQETWAGLAGQAVADANLPALAQAPLPYIISTGGEGNLFTCSTDDGMERFIQRYRSPYLLGFDFDIEHTQAPENIQQLVARVKAAQMRHPQLRWSFTLPTFAASDASRASLNALGLQVLAAVRAAELKDVVFNLMVMNYGKPSASVCVVRRGRCNMAASALQAARNLHAAQGIPMNRIALTAMIGVNDVTDNVFTPSDATRLARFAQREKLAGLHFWSLDRDRPCPGAAQQVSATCSGLPRPGPLGFARAFAQGLR